MYALVEIKGKQYKVEKGSVVTVDRLKNTVGDTVEFDSVLMTSEDGDVKVGQPYLKGVKVRATVTEEKKGKKVIIFKFKRRKNYKKKQGHRQKYSVLKIEDIIEG